MPCAGCGLETGAEGAACPVCRSRRLNRLVRFSCIGLFIGLLAATVLLSTADRSPALAGVVAALPLLSAFVGYWLASRRS